MSAFFVFGSGFMGYQAWDAYRTPKQEPKIAIVTPAPLSHDSESHVVRFVDSAKAKAQLNFQAKMRGVQVAVCHPQVNASEVPDMIQKAEGQCKVVISEPHLDSQVQAVQGVIDNNKDVLVHMPLIMLLLTVPGALGSAFLGFVLRKVLPKKPEQAQTASG